MGRTLPALVLLAIVAGCGTTRWSDTARTATEQMLISDAVDRAVSQIDFSVLEGRNVYLDARFIFGTVDDRYIISTLRQHMLASGCVLKEKLEEADFIAEVRTGAVGTNRNDLLFGSPATQLPALGATVPVGAAIPEISIFKRTSQQGVCKIAVFAYDRISGQPVWQSGSRRVNSKSRDLWVLGAGPFQSGSIYDGTKLSGEKFRVPISSEPDKAAAKTSASDERVWVAQEILFESRPTAVASQPPTPARQASFSQPVTPSLSPMPPVAAPIPTTPQMVPPNPAAPPPVVPTSIKSTQPAPNPAAATLGAIQAYDWAKAVHTEGK
jgi:hypothetical protein